MMIECTFCGLGYCDDVLDDINLHRKMHNKALNCPHNFITGRKIEELKTHGWDLFYNPKSCIDDKFIGYTEILFSWYSRSLTANKFNPKHPNFKVFASQMLYQDHIKDNFDINNKEVYEKLVDTYGILPGMKEGSSYWCDR